MSLLDLVQEYVCSVSNETISGQSDYLRRSFKLWQLRLQYLLGTSLVYANCGNRRVTRLVTRSWNYIIAKNDRLLQCFYKITTRVVGQCWKREMAVPYRSVYISVLSQTSAPMLSTQRLQAPVICCRINTWLDLKSVSTHLSATGSNASLVRLHIWVSSG